MEKNNNNQNTDIYKEQEQSNISKKPRFDTNVKYSSFPLPMYPGFQMSMDQIYDELYKFIETKLLPLGEHNIELEAKFGQFIDKKTNSRLWLPITTEAIIQENRLDVKFVSDMPIHYHNHMNKVLNECIQKDPTSLSYQRKLETDNFYQQHQRDRLRVTVDTKTGKYINSMRKERIADLALFVPMLPFDVRISINQEFLLQESDIKAIISDMSRLLHSRRKNRLTYTFPNQSCQLDLTQVDTLTSDKDKPSRTHELELEWVNISSFFDKIECESNIKNLRMMIRHLCMILSHV